MVMLGLAQAVEHKLAQVKFGDLTSRAGAVINFELVVAAGFIGNMRR